jgi:hypothetical protein
MTMGDRVAVMKNGRIQQCAPPQELYDQPANVFVAGFIGGPKMNLAGSGQGGGIWAAPAQSITGPYDIRSATRLADPGLHVGKLVQDPLDNWVLLAFVETDELGGFGGFLIDPRRGKPDVVVLVGPRARGGSYDPGERQPAA